MKKVIQKISVSIFVSLSIVLGVSMLGCSSMQQGVEASPTVGNVWGLSEMPLEDLNALYTNEESEWMEIEGLRIHYRDEGNPNGQPIVLVHGILSSLHTWDDWNQELRKDYRVISMDLPGFGLTGGPEDTDKYTEAFLHSSFQTFLDNLKLDDFILVGNSLGGYLSANYAAANPDKVEKLILIDPAGAPQDLPFILNLASLPGINSLAANVFPPFVVAMGVKDVYGDPERISKAHMDRYIHLALRPGAKRAYAKTIEILDEKNDKQEPLNFTSVTTPTLLLWGEKDIWVPVTLSSQWLETLPNAQLITYPSAGHVPMEEIPDKTLADALSFINAE